MRRATERPWVRCSRGALCAARQGPDADQRPRPIPRAASRPSSETTTSPISPARELTVFG